MPLIVGNSIVHSQMRLIVGDLFHSVNLALSYVLLTVSFVALASAQSGSDESKTDIGREVAIPHHLQDGEEFDISVHDLVAYGKKLFDAHFTREEAQDDRSPKEPERRSPTPILR